jgi:hypothetical protein
MPFPVPSSRRFGSGNNVPLKKSQVNVGYRFKTVDGSDVVFIVYKCKVTPFYCLNELRMYFYYDISETQSARSLLAWMRRKETLNDRFHDWQSD